MNISTFSDPRAEISNYYSELNHRQKSGRLELFLTSAVLLASCYFAAYSVFGDCPFSVFSAELLELASPKATLGFLASN